jgi:hypothetical protein
MLWPVGPDLRGKFNMVSGTGIQGHGVWAPSKGFGFEKRKILWGARRGRRDLVGDWRGRGSWLLTNCF